VLRAELGTTLWIGLELQHHRRYGLLPPPTLVSSMRDSSTYACPRFLPRVAPGACPGAWLL